ncbi:MAG: haloacid dehalogenase-like hydrolase [Polyangiaceae bacterium]|nr:haloacid dehalogenase-like hydrolase [Polyangiaceae bacterium]
MPSAPRVVLFDIDGTLITFTGPAPGPGRTALDRAMRDLYRIEQATDEIRVAGGTDRALARALLERAGAPGDDVAIDRVIASYLAHLAAIVEERAYRAIGDVTGTVERLSSHACVIGLGTGNVRVGAAIKLASAGLSATFDLARGGYGCDAEPRAEILRRAVERCWPGGDCAVVVVGDTDRDVEAGRALGARIVGVATSDNARRELVAAGADAVVSECGDALADACLRS